MGTSSTSRLARDRASDREDAVSGAFVGLAVGDAIGLRVEGNLPSQCRAFAKDLKPCLTKGITKGFLKKWDGRWPLGQYSDDTQLSRELLLGIMEAPSNALAEGELAMRYAKRIAALYKQSKIVGCGMATAKALTRIIKGVPLENFGSAEGLAGNSPSVRGVIMGLINPALFEKEGRDHQDGKTTDDTCLLSACAAQSRVTHRDPYSVLCALVMCIAVRCILSLEAGELDALGSKRSFLRSVGARLESFCDAEKDREGKGLEAKGRLHTILNCLRSTGDALGTSFDKALATVRVMGYDEDMYKPQDKEGVSGFAVPSTMWALYTFLRSPGDFSEVLLATIRGGGDTDSTAALACGLAGAHVGHSHVPELFKRLLQDQGEHNWNEMQLTKLGKRIAQRRR